MNRCQEKTRETIIEKIRQPTEIDISGLDRERTRKTPGMILVKVLESFDEISTHFNIQPKVCVF